MTEDSYRKALDDLKRERDKLTAIREDADRRLARIDAAIANLAVVVDDEPFEGGLTEAVRTVLKRRPGAPTPPTQVRDGLKEIGYDLDKHNNIMASVHSVLKRLAETPDVEALKSSVEGGWLYRWKGKAPIPVTPRANQITATQDALKEIAKVTAAMNSPTVRDQMAAIASAASGANMKAVNEAMEQINAATKELARLKAAGLL